MDNADLKKQIDAAKQPKWLDKRLEVLAKFPLDRLRDLKKLIGNRAKYYADHEKNVEQIETTAAFFDAITPAERRELWVGLFPSVASHLERAWVDLSRRPLGLIDYAFRDVQFPFRSPEREQQHRLFRARYFMIMCDALRGLDPKPGWLAAWVSHLEFDYRDPAAVAWLLGSVLRGGGQDAEEVRSVLVDSINGQHEIGRMSEHAIIAMLNSDEPDDWEVIGKLLLAAQRQEGLRQSILESAGESSPPAFRYLLGLILEHDLSRFSAVVRAFDVWLGFHWAGGSIKVVHEGIERLCRFFDDAQTRSKAIESGSAEDVYLALWVTAFENSDAALRAARPLVHDDDPGRRVAALLITQRIGHLPETIEFPASRLLSGDETDERVLTLICMMLAESDFRKAPKLASDELFDAVARVFEQFPAKNKPLEDLIWPWDGWVRERRDPAQALGAITVDQPKRLLPFASALDAYDCASVIRELAGLKAPWERARGSGKRSKRRALDSDDRAFIVNMMADARQAVHEVAFEALRGSPVSAAEVELLLKNLQRTGATFRRGAISRLAELPPESKVSVGERLLDAKQLKKRAAGLELLQTLGEDEEFGPQANALVEQRREAFVGSAELENAAELVLAESSEQTDAGAYFGLVAPENRAPAIVPQYLGVPRETEAAKACLLSLAELMLQHGETEIVMRHQHLEPGEAEKRVQITEHFPAPGHLTARTDPVGEPLAGMPMREVWVEWERNRSQELRDPDGLELIRAWALTDVWNDNWLKLMPKPFRAEKNWSLQYAFKGLSGWLPSLADHAGGLAYLVQRLEDSIATRESAKDDTKGTRFDHESSKQSHDISLVEEFLQIARVGHRKDTPALRARFAALQMLASDRGIPGCEQGPSLDDFCQAFRAGLVTASDLIVLLLHERFPEEERVWRHRFGPIKEVTRFRQDGCIAEHPELVTAVDRVRDRLLEIELMRGERSTPATVPASEIRFAGGAEVLFRLIAALGRDKIMRQDQWGEPTRAYSFSRLISVTTPREVDTDERFAVLMTEHQVKPPRLLEIGMYAPQWAGHVERATDSSGFEDAVWWIHAHTKRSDAWRNQEIRELWEAQIKERTNLDAADLEEGAVDVAWFSRLIEKIGVPAWTAFQKPARFASNSGGHKRAQLFADAMLGMIEISDLVPKIDEQRNQDAVRAFGLVPLPKEVQKAQAETLTRYKRLQEFKRQSRKFGSQRQASEGRAVEIGMQNLARTAGYRDPRRLQWAMESEAVADLAKGPVHATVEETTVSLSLDASGLPELIISNKGKLLKSVPAKLRKHAEIAELKSRVPELRKQGARMRRSLEESMCRGDGFSGAELTEFYAHPMLQPMIKRLVFVSAHDIGSTLVGYPDENGRVLRGLSGVVESIGKRDLLRLAHPSDLRSRGDWHNWQRECFEAERMQPFKQVFRELYLRTKSEQGNCEMSRRYAGHQVNPRQALALLKQRQWFFAPEEGCRRVFHDEGLVAELWFQEHFHTPAEVDGLTLEGIAFRTKGGDRHAVHLMDVPERLFSEVMRDLDLAVSVAHAGGVDPEASASTIEMRATLLGETCRLLGLNNVRVDGHHAVIDGTRARYSVHLGSATTQVLPGRMLVIVAVHSQYRGRIFLPFADEDPRTAEVMTKTLLLARDQEIKDPSILGQIS